MKLGNIFKGSLKKKAFVKILEILIDALIDFKEHYKRNITINSYKSDNFRNIQNHL